MSDYEDYGDGDDFGYGDENENKYDDEYENDDFGYGRDEEEFKGSYRDSERAGQVFDENDALRTSIDKGNLGNQQRRYEMMHMEPIQDFRNKVRQILIEEEELFLNRDDKETIKKGIDKLPFIKYKNPLTYVLGYYMQQETSNIRLNKIKKYTSENENITMSEIIKYSRYWSKN
jgi:hypothetical protein